VSVLVVFWSEEDADNTLLGLGRFSVDAYFEWQMGQTVLAGLDDNIFTVVMGDTAESSQFGSLLFGWGLDVHGIGDVGLEFLEVSGESVYFNGGDLDAIECGFGLGVRWESVLEAPVELYDALVQLPEDWIAQLGFVTFQNGWDNGMMVDMVLAVRVAEHTDDLVHVLVETGVHAVWVALDQVAEVFNAFWFGDVNDLSVLQFDVSLVDSFQNAGFVDSD